MTVPCQICPDHHCYVSTGSIRQIFCCGFMDSAQMNCCQRKIRILTNRLIRSVIGQCTITGSSDSSIRDVVPNDLRAITEHAPIERIFCNGNTSLKYYRRYNEPLLGRPAVVLPSTSPANAAWSLQRLAEAWRVIL